MADDSKSSNRDLSQIRKLRKKLRQIENLNRLGGSRDLTEEESLKVSCLSTFRFNADLKSVHANSTTLSFLMFNRGRL